MPTQDSRITPLARRVRELRIRAGLTQADLAGRVGKTRPTITRIERGWIRPSGLLVSHIARELGVDRESIDPDGVTL